jgi:hypothetical protein
VHAHPDRRRHTLEAQSSLRQAGFHTRLVPITVVLPVRRHLPPPVPLLPDALLGNIGNYKLRWRGKFSLNFPDQVFIESHGLSVNPS